MDEEEKAPKPKLQPKPSKGAKARDPFIRQIGERLSRCSRPTRGGSAALARRVLRFRLVGA